MNTYCFENKFGFEFFVWLVFFMLYHKFLFFSFKVDF